MASSGDTGRPTRRWPPWVAVGAVAVFAIAALVTTVGASQAERAADDAEAEVVEARQTSDTAQTELHQVRADTRAARRDLRALRGLFAPGMAETLRAAFLLVAAEVCSQPVPEAPEALQAAVDAVDGQVPGLAVHEGWEAAIDPAQIAEGCAGG